MCFHYQAEEPTHPFQPGDVVIVQRLAKGRKQIEFLFGPPTQVVAVTRTAILTEEAPIWINASRVKRVPEVPSLALNRDKKGEAALQAFCPRPRDVGHEYIEYLQMNHKRISVRTGISSLLPGAECRLLTFSFALHCSQEETHTAASIEETHRIGYQRMSYSREPTHPFQPGDMVIVQRLAKGRKQIEFPFGPPTRVVAVTRTVILTEEAQIWIHASRVKRVSEASSPASNEDKEGKAGVKSLGKEGHLEEVSLKSALPQAEDDDPTIFWEICLSVDNY
ncbi:uncharacterized protein [Pyxicephalus adspersus]|uniref:uncharacterized protein isoform X2 n=1 Tax=Pyxicephalus adspersus TaxID=30357 RepID=UPI003B5B8EE7